ELDAALLKKFQANKRAWTYFQSRPPGYRRICTFFVMGAKRDETRARRLQMLIEYSAKGKPLPMLG
ncbi:MAG: bacteriocin-protection protein, partial [Betaproteobacteria bacterium]